MGIIISSIPQLNLSTKIILSAFGSYAIISLFFFFYPQLIHKEKYLKRKSNRSQKFVVISHRGGGCEQAENTLEAFEYSSKIGVDIIELDCHLTKDKQVVVSHDAHLYRVCGVDKFIYEYNYEDLPPIEMSEADHRTNYYMKFFTPKLNLSDEDLNRKYRIPRLEDVFKHLPPRMRFNIDVKAINDELMHKVNELIIKYEKEDQIVWGSFNQRTVKKLQKLNPRVSSFFSLVGIFKLFVLAYTGLLPFVSIDEDHFEILYPDAYLSKELPWKLYIFFLFAKLFVTRRCFLRHLQMRGINVYFWVLNSRETFESAIRLGADGIMTDIPSVLIDLINEKYPHLTRLNNQ